MRRICVPHMAAWKAGVPPVADLTTDLVALWLFNESSGNLVDEIASAAITPAGTPSYQQVAKVESYSFGFSSSASAGPTGKITNGTFTVAGWLYLTSQAAGTGLFLLDGTWDFYVVITPSLVYAFRNDGEGGVNVVESSGTWGSGEWHYLAISRIAANTWKVWVDGELLSLSTNVAQTSDFSAYELKLEQSGTASRIEQLAVWNNRILSNTDVSALYNSGLGLAYSSW